MFNKESLRFFFKEFCKGFLKYDLKIILAMFAFSIIYGFLGALYFKGFLKLEFDYVTYFLDNIFCHIKNLDDRKKYQQILVDEFLRIIEWNEFCFYINTNSIEFQEAKILYQVKLHFFLEKLNLDVFDDSNEALRFITEFYDHYLKIIELNNEVIKNISINEKYYTDYNTFCFYIYRIIYFIIYIRFILYLMFPLKTLKSFFL